MTSDHEYQAALKLILDEHAKWYTSKGLAGIQLDLSDKFLAKACFVKADLQGCNFSEADLRLANLAGANLKETNFSQISLIDAGIVKERGLNSR